MSDRARQARLFGGWVVYILTALLALSACSSPPADVESRAQPPSWKISEHRVSPGETLYSIAWRYDLDYRRLARHNDISPPYTIYPGQVLDLAVAQDAPGVAKPDSPASTGKSEKPAERAATDASDQKRSKNKTPPEPSDPLPDGKPQWRWPVEGRVLSAFGASTGLNRGIDIAGELGDSVVAAAKGRVVYAGSGLRGYGNLVIIKHNETYLSAYAHNRRLRVAEGDSIDAGEVIAEMGSSGTDSVRLHFEIRRDGKPVDPIGYLPQR